ncbi:MAG: serine--tRNA ligase [Lentisphaeria bacterium]|nr:serine--tRNA ligase [Lentisphaeria bacterium]NQZ67421.1 serine--tRNA ligase [Lentisphaeria bacterium]
MIDIKILRKNPELIKDSMERRGDTNVDIDELVKLDQDYLQLIQDVQALQEQRNTKSKECKDNPDAREEVKVIKVELAEKDELMKTLKLQIDEKMAWLPNFLSDDAPAGLSDEDNTEFKVVGEKPQFDFEPKDHQELGEALDIIDAARGAKVAQAGFYYWKGKGAILAQSLFFWTQMELVKRGFTLFMTPCVAKESTLFGTGYLPFFADQTYKLDGEDLSLIGTSEQTLVAYYGDEILNSAEFPLKSTAFTPCFRTEAGSYGKASRGIHRVHQFHKVEQIIFCKPEDSPTWHEHCQENAEYLASALGLAYHVVNVCIGDMGAPGYKKYDIEAWFPGFGGYREITSNTNLTDFQSRRLNIRYKDENKKNQFVHTISSTAVTDRVVCAIMESYQQEDGSILIPEVLQPFCGFDKIEAGN